ncbi:MAG: hypothetical protein FWC61_04550 [Proteobacteria bacterium]|nr:hypothetical protein [Pseudomonadota bacterium]
MSDIKRNGENASQTAQKFVEMYYEADQHIKTPFLPGAVNTVKNLLKNHPVHICSANKYSCKSDKKYADYLTKEIGNFEEIYFVKPSESKSGYYESVKERFPDDEIIVIEDSGRHINDAESIGLKTLKCDRKIGIAGLKSFAP